MLFNGKSVGEPNFVIKLVKCYSDSLAQKTAESLIKKLKNKNPSKTSYNATFADLDDLIKYEQLI